MHQEKNSRNPTKKHAPSASIVAREGGREELVMTGAQDPAQNGIHVKVASGDNAGTPGGWGEVREECRVSLLGERRWNI